MMVKRRQKRVGKRRKPNRLQPEPGEYGQFSIKRLQHDLNLAADSEAHSKADGALELEHKEEG